MSQLIEACWSNTLKQWVDARGIGLFWSLDDTLGTSSYLKPIEEVKLLPLFAIPALWLGLGGLLIYLNSRR